MAAEAAGTGIDQGRSAYREQRWTEAFEKFIDADQRGGLPAADLERLATAEILIGHTTAGLDTLTRAHEEFLVLGDLAGAARCAGWLGMQLMGLREKARSSGWFARGRSVLDELGEPSAVEGILLLPVALRKLYRGDPAGALEVFSEIGVYGQRFQDKDLAALSLVGRGQATPSCLDRPMKASGCLTK